MNTRTTKALPHSRQPLAMAVSLLAGSCTLLAVPLTAQEVSPSPPYVSPVHVFSIDDLQSGFDGSTYGPAGAAQDPAAICGLPGGTACPATTDPATGLPLVAPFVDKEGVTLYPVDSEFGFEVVDFLGAKAKTRDTPRDYQEGFVGNIYDGTEVVGIKISNAETDTYKVKPPMGTWCQGLGGTSVKCSTEHYVVMEHALSCHEVVPYYFADPFDGSQAYLSYPDSSDGYSCAEAELDDNAFILTGGVAGGLLTSVVPGDQMEANDNTTVRDDIAVSSDYSITLKDDGKPLYRWGGLIKRPNDVRLYAKLPLPDAWKVAGVDYQIQSAKLVVTHWITNNPNDQLRPEDLENEAATGRKPSYRIDSSGNWVSTRDCYEGDGDYLDSEEGSTDPTTIAAGTLFKNNSASYAIPAGVNPPLAFSSDLSAAFTNAYYTTIHRDPFEWSYVDANAATSGEFEFIGTALPLSAEEAADRGLELVSGPRWRLKGNKFGQDIPGLEIPLIECSAPPFARENVRYEVGEAVTTVINLLDWDEAVDGPSPLSSSKGWVDVTQNGFVTIAETVNNVPVTTNGLPMTDDFDLAVYIKGDRKPTAVFTAQLLINEDVDLPVPESDLSITTLKVPSKVNTLRDNILISAVVTNDTAAQASGSGILTITAIDENQVEIGNFSATFSGIEPGKKENFQFRWTSPAARTDVMWTATVTVDGQVVSMAQGMTLVRDKG